MAIAIPSAIVSVGGAILAQSSKQQLTQLHEAPADPRGPDSDTEVAAVYACVYAEGDKAGAAFPLTL